MYVMLQNNIQIPTFPSAVCIPLYKYKYFLSIAGETQVMSLSLVLVLVAGLANATNSVDPGHRPIGTQPITKNTE